MRQIILSFVVGIYSFSLLSGLRAQSNPVPDSSFETWSGGAPSGWTVDSTQVVASSDAHSGLWAASGKVIMGSSVAPFLATSFPTLFPIGYRPSSLEGYYKFTGAGGDEVLFFAMVTSARSPVAVASFVDTSNVSGYRYFNIPLWYSADDPPDSAKILIEIENSQGTLHAGSSFVIDDITLAEMMWDPFISVQPTPTQVQSFSSYPNPFSQSTTISFTCESSCYADIRIVNLLGTEVMHLFSGELSAGGHSYVWSNPTGLPAGMYECTVNINGRVERMPMVLTR